MLRLKPECKVEVEGEGVVEGEVEVEGVVEGETEVVVEVGRRCFPAAYPPERFS